MSTDRLSTGVRQRLEPGRLAGVGEDPRERLEGELRRLEGFARQILDRCSGRAMTEREQADLSLVRDQIRQTRLQLGLSFDWYL